MSEQGTLADIVRTDLVIIGGGMTGMTLAVAVASAGLDVCLVERQAMPVVLAESFDGRVTAVAQGSRRLLESIGVWEGLAAGAQPILDIEVGERGSGAMVRYDHREVGSEPLGHIVENRAIRRVLATRAAGLPSLHVLASASVVETERDALRGTVRLADGRSLRAPLVIAAEGKESATREAAGIGVKRWDYAQTAMVCTLEHPEPHEGRAIERFFPDGPFAMLPLTGDRSSIVWAAENGLAATLTALPDGDFVAEIAARFGPALGTLTLAGPRWSYPLSLVWADRYTDTRLALVGDTARAIHPIAGQGWNLALRDVAALAEIVVDHARLGLDPGSDQALAAYERWRGFDSVALVAVTDGINRLFANDLWPLKIARDTGLAMVERLRPAKRFFMRHAMGLVGDLPRTMRGEAL